MFKISTWKLMMTGMLLVLLAGCSGEEAASGKVSTGKGSVQGQVTMPLEGAALYVYKPGMDLYGPAFAVSRASDNEGRFAIDLPDGDYVVVARKRVDGAETGPVVAGDNRSEFMQISVRGAAVDLQVSAPVKVGDERRFTGDAEVTKTGFSGLITDSDGQPAEGVRVHVYDHVQMSERPKYVSEKTGPDGRFLIHLPAGGTYYLAARDKFGGPPKLGDLYGRYDKGTIEPSAVVVEEGQILEGVDITVTKVW